MAIWRDPLDELINDLVRLMPSAPPGGPFTFEKLTALTDAILYGTELEAEILMADPEFQTWIAGMARR